MTEAAASVEWIVASGEVDALMLEYNLIQTHRPRFNIRYRDDKSYPVPGAHDGGALAACAGAARREAEGGALLRAVRARLGDPRHARRPDPGVPGPDVFERVLRPAGARETALPLLRHRAVRGPVRALGDRCHRGDLPRVTSTRWPSSSSGNERPVLRRLEREMRVASEREEFEQAAKLRDQLFAARRALEPQEMVLSTAGGPRRGRPRRGRSRGGVPGVLRPTWSGARAQGLGRRPGRGPRPAPAGRVVPRAAVHGAAGGPAAGAGPGRARRPDVARDVAAPAGAAARSGSPCRPAARSASCSRS